jgi:sugar/nucleoside kinase (ribokinase family)
MVVKSGRDSKGNEFKARPELTCGGSAANTAMILSQLGVCVAFVGRDAFGNIVAGSLSDAGVDISKLIQLDDAYTTVVIAVVYLDGTHTMKAWPLDGGADLMLESSHGDISVFSNPIWLHSTGLSIVKGPTRETVLRAMSYARNQGVPVSFDLNMTGSLGHINGMLEKQYEHNLRAAIELSDCVFGSASDEIALLYPHENVSQAVRGIAGKTRTAISRRGELAAICASGSELIESKPFQIDTVDTIGAGDAFNAGFIAAQLEDLSIEKSLQWGHATAGLSIKTVGSGGKFDRIDVLKFIEQQPKLV